MKPISELIPKVVLDKKSRKTWRGELYREFMKKLNPSRKEKGLPPLTEARLGYMLKGIPDGDLEHLKSRCEKAKNYSSLFWHLISPKKKDAQGA